MSIKSISTEKAPAAVGPYSQGIEVGNLVYTSGQIPVDTSTGEIELKDIRRATSLCMENVKAILEEAGTDLDHVIKVMIFITNMDDFAAVNEVYAEYFPNTKPARSCVEISRLPKDVNVEIEAIALKE